MKKLLLIMCMFLIASVSYAGYSPGNTVEVNASTYTAITTTAKHQPFNFTIWLADLTAFYIASSSTGADEQLIPVVNGAAVYSNTATAPNGIVIYVKSAVGTLDCSIEVGLR